jgi:hypothetical protein
VCSSDLQTGFIQMDQNELEFTFTRYLQ